MNEIVVVGAGPAGASAARCASEKGHSVLLIEEHQEIGEPIQCAGIVSAKTIEEAGISEGVVNEIKGAYFYSPNMDELLIDAGEVKAHVVDRGVFDKELVNLALDRGSKLKLNTKAVGWDGNELVVRENGNKEKIKTKALIGADGVKSRIRREITDLEPSSYLPGAQVVLKDVDVRDSDFVELFLGNEYAPGFFSWFIPIDDDKGRLGLCVSEGNNPLFYLKNLLKNHPVVSERYDGEEVEWNFGAVPIGFLEKTFFNNTVLVGDAGGLAKPTTGGGVYTGLVSGKLAAEAICLFLEEDVPLSLYQEKMKNEIGGELKKGMALHRSWRDFSDEQIIELINYLNDPKIREVITEVGDMDYPSKLVYELIKNKPSLIKYGLSFFRNYLGELL